MRTIHRAIRESGVFYTMKIWKGLGLFFLALLVIAAALLAVWQTTVSGIPAVALLPQQRMDGLSASVGDLPADLKTQQAQLDALPEIVKSTGGDTLYYTLNAAEGIGWNDKRFAADPRLLHEELFGLATRTFDALDYLAESCARQEIRLVAVLDVNLLEKGASGDAALDDEELVMRLSAVVRDLSRDHGIGALVLAFSDAPTDSTRNRESLSGIARQCAVPLGLELPASHSLLRAGDTGMAFAVARLRDAADAEAAAVLAKEAQNAGKMPVLWVAEGAQQLASAAYFAAGQGGLSAGVVWGSVRQADLEPAVLQAAKQSVSALEKYDGGILSVPTAERKLAVSYPANDAVLYSGQVYVMGMSDPSAPLYVNGAQVARGGSTGAFGVLVPLEEGDNTITVSQGADSVALRVQRVRSGDSGGAQQYDGTTRLYEGQRIRVTSWIASVLSDPDNEDMIKETAKRGGVAVVNRCATTVRNGKYTYIYELTTGGWICAYHCEPVSENIGPWPLAEPAVTADGENEYITLVRGGTALGYDSWDEEAGVLTVTLANTTATDGGIAVNSRFVTGAQVETVQGGVKLTFRVDGAQQLWGYDVTYNEAGDTVLFLKAAPKLALDSAHPLEGAVILLDAGHGADDNGAMGIAGALGGPKEKDLNLAVTLATRARLEQMGATVVMVREDDTFLSLEDRSRLAHETHPDLYLALHHNSVDLTVDANAVSGASAYYFTLPGKQLADCLLPQVAAAGRRENDGSGWSYFYVTRMTYAPAVLLEYGFLVNPVEYELCSDPLTILREGDATARGIVEFFRQRLA